MGRQLVLAPPGPSTPLATPTDAAKHCFQLRVFVALFVRKITARKRLDCRGEMFRIDWRWC